MSVTVYMYRLHTTGKSQPGEWQITLSCDKIDELKTQGGDVEAIWYTFPTDAEARSFGARMIGMAPSAAMSEAARENGRRGGRPRKGLEKKKAPKGDEPGLF